MFLDPKTVKILFWPNYVIFESIQNSKMTLWIYESDLKWIGRYIYIVLASKILKVKIMESKKCMNFRYWQYWIKIKKL